MKKVLFLATYGDFLATFELSNISLWNELGYEVHCASNFKNEEYNLRTVKLLDYNAKLHEIAFDRKPFTINNIREYKRLINLIKKEKFDVIDTHNAVVSAFARIAAQQCGVKKVIYTPHSFFFYKGCSIKNNIIYKNVESFLARKTDLLITINKEDYEAAKKMPVRGKAIYVPGVGIDTNKIINLPVDKRKYCKEFSIPEDACIFISVGELINRKNHITAIKAFAKANISNSYYLICGIGELKEELNSLIENLGMKNRILLLGYRIDAKEIMKASDIFIFPSYQEGLPVALMEAMACGLPCIVSNIRGNVDLIQDKNGGWLFEPNDVKELAKLMRESIKENKIKDACKQLNQNKIKIFDKINVRNIMKEEYLKIIGDKV